MTDILKITDSMSYDGSKQIFLGGNCVLENKDIAFKTAEFLKKLSEKLNVLFIFKASYKKDNRSDLDFFHGMPLDQALRIFEEIKKEFDIPLVTDLHYPTDLDEGVAEVVDIIQIPAYLVMQSGLVTAAAKTGKVINLKKAQFLHPQDMEKVCKKVVDSGNNSIILTERGTCFGYRDMVVDPRSFYIMKSFGYPVLFDAGHSVRKYGIPSSDPKGGAKEYLDVLMGTCAAANIDGLFVEVHPEPAKALCDAASQLDFQEAEKLITKYFRIAHFVKELS